MDIDYHNDKGCSRHKTYRSMTYTMGYLEHRGGYTLKHKSLINSCFAPNLGRKAHTGERATTYISKEKKLLDQHGYSDRNVCAFIERIDGLYYKINNINCHAIADLVATFPSVEKYFPFEKFSTEKQADIILNSDTPVFFHKLISLGKRVPTTKWVILLESDHKEIVLDYIVESFENLNSSLCNPYSNDIVCKGLLEYAKRKNRPSIFEKFDITAVRNPQTLRQLVKWYPEIMKDKSLKELEKTVLTPHEWITVIGRSLTPKKRAHFPEGTADFLRRSAFSYSLKTGKRNNCLRKQEDWESGLP